jgi:hypothetical protein
MPRRIGSADHRADRGADHHIGNDAVGNQRTDDADMGKSARGAAAQRKTDHRPPDAAEADLVVAVGAFLATPHPIIQHRKLLFGLLTIRYGLALPVCSASMVYAASGPALAGLRPAE